MPELNATPVTDGDSDVGLPPSVRVLIAQLIDDHYKSVQGRDLRPYHVDIVVHIREEGTNEPKPPIRVVHVFASKHKKNLHPYIFEATKRAIDTRIQMTMEEIENAATAS